MVHTTDKTKDKVRQGEQEAERLERKGRANKLESNLGRVRRHLEGKAIDKQYTRKVHRKKRKTHERGKNMGLTDKERSIIIMSDKKT